MTVKYPEIDVQLSGLDSNAFALLGAVAEALRVAGVDRQEGAEFMKEATAGTYDELLATCMSWVNVS